MKKLISAMLCLMLFALTFTACGSNEKTTIDIAAVRDDILSSCGLDDMIESSEEDITGTMYNFTDGTYKAIVCSRSMAPEIADEITIVEANSSDDIEAVKEVLQARVDARSNVFGGYAPEESKKCNDAKIVSKGNYVLLAICEDTSKAVDTFKDSFKN